MSVIDKERADTNFLTLPFSIMKSDAVWAFWGICLNIIFWSLSFFFLQYVVLAVNLPGSFRPTVVTVSPEATRVACRGWLVLCQLLMLEVKSSVSFVKSSSVAEVSSDAIIIFFPSSSWFLTIVWTAMIIVLFFFQILRWLKTSELCKLEDLLLPLLLQSDKHSSIIQVVGPAHRCQYWGGSEVCSLEFYFFFCLGLVERLLLSSATSHSLYCIDGVPAGSCEPLPLYIHYWMSLSREVDFHSPIPDRKFVPSSTYKSSDQLPRTSAVCQA